MNAVLLQDLGLALGGGLFGFGLHGLVNSWKHSFYRKALPTEKKADGLPWDELASGSTITLGGGYIGYVANIDGKPWWWVARNGRSIVEGPATDISGARVAVLQCALDFDLARAELR